MSHHWSEPQTLALSSAWSARILALSEAGFPHEVCGALAGTVDGATWRVVRCLEAENDWAAMDLVPDDPSGTERRFAIAPLWILQAERALRAEGLELIGFYHSHPGAPAEPSETDRKYLWPGHIHVICSVRSSGTDAVRAWYLPEDGGIFREVTIDPGE